MFIFIYHHIVKINVEKNTKYIFIRDAIIKN